MIDVDIIDEMTNGLRFTEFMAEVGHVCNVRGDITLMPMVWEVHDYFNSVANLLINNNKELKLDDISDPEPGPPFFGDKIKQIESHELTYLIYDKMMENINNAIFVNIYSQLEFYMYQICNLYMKSDNITMSVVKENGHSTLEKAKNYLENKIGINKIGLSNEWKLINNEWRIIRNSIVHNKGIIKLNKVNELLVCKNIIFEEYDIILDKKVMKIHLDDITVLRFMVLAEKMLVNCVK